MGDFGGSKALVGVSALFSSSTTMSGELFPVSSGLSLFADQDVTLYVTNPC